MQLLSIFLFGARTLTFRTSFDFRGVTYSKIGKCFIDSSCCNGQLISKCLFGVIVWNKRATKIMSGSFLALLGTYLVSNIINKEATRTQKKLPGSPQEVTKISGQKSLQFFLCFFGQNDDTKKTFRN